MSWWWLGRKRPGAGRPLYLVDVSLMGCLLLILMLFILVTTAFIAARGLPAPP